jgi:hypothetical protein
LTWIECHATERNPLERSCPKNRGTA